MRTHEEPGRGDAKMESPPCALFALPLGEERRGEEDQTEDERSHPARALRCEI